MKYDNTGPQPVHVTRLLVKLGPGVTLVDSPSRYVLVPRHQDRMLMGWQSIGDDATNDTLSVEAEFEDHLGFSFHCDGEGRITAAIQPE